MTSKPTKKQKRALKRGRLVLKHYEIDLGQFIIDFRLFERLRGRSRTGAKQARHGS